MGYSYCVPLKEKALLRKLYVIFFFLTGRKLELAFNYLFFFTQFLLSSLASLFPFFFSVFPSIFYKFLLSTAMSKVFSLMLEIQKWTKHMKIPTLRGRKQILKRLINKIKPGRKKKVYRKHQITVEILIWMVKEDLSE